MNVGAIDRIIRAVLGVVVLSLVFILEGNVRWWGLLGLVPLVTAVVGYCPLYAVLGNQYLRNKKGGYHALA